MKLVLDTFSEVHDLLRHRQTAEFWEFADHDIIPGAVYLFGRTQFTRHVEQIRSLALAGTIQPVLSNPAEGSDTMRWQIEGLGCTELVKQGRILVLTGGYLPADYPALYYENYLPKLLDYKENRQAAEEYSQQFRVDRPYRFLFLNGRGRRHRQQLIQRLAPVLDSAVWTNLDAAAGPIRTLPDHYEFDFYQGRQQALADSGFVKYDLFNNTWGEIYLKSAPYCDTHFSLVTETVFDYPYTFRTEKIWKPICIGHPFIVASNAGYYRDLHRLGFRTFGHLIDESFDLIDDNRERLERIAQTVEWLCSQDLASFTQAAQEVCKYNQQQMAELRPKIRAEFPQRFEQFIHERSRV